MIVVVVTQIYTPDELHRMHIRTHDNLHRIYVCTHTHTLVCVHTCNTGEILMSSVYLSTVNALVVILCPSRRLPPWGHWGQGARALLHCCQSWSINRRTHHLLIIIPLCTFCEFCESVTLSQLKVNKKKGQEKKEKLHLPIKPSLDLGETQPETAATAGRRRVVTVPRDVSFKEKSDGAKVGIKSRSGSS